MRDSCLTKVNVDIDCLDIGLTTRSTTFGTVVDCKSRSNGVCVVDDVVRDVEIEITDSRGRPRTTRRRRGTTSG